MLLTSSLLLVSSISLACAACPDYSDYSQEYHGPFSSGAYNLSYMRPSEACRTFKISEIENVLQQMKSVIKDPDLYRLFLNSYPSTLDTAVKWKGTASGSDEELAFIITGCVSKHLHQSQSLTRRSDINAMWLRDSANQMQSYLGYLKPSSSSNSLASVGLSSAIHLLACDADCTSSIAGSSTYKPGIFLQTPSVIPSNLQRSRGFSRRSTRRHRTTM